MDIPVPFLETVVGLGDAVKNATSAAGVKPCGGCKQRAEKLNKAVRFVPAKSALPAATVGQPYAAPVTGMVTGGRLPLGLFWDSNAGVVHGVPREAGRFEMKLANRSMVIEVKNV